MAKQITRTIITYEYTFAKAENKDGKLTVTGTAKAFFPEKMGERKMKQYIKGNPELTGYLVAGYEEKSVTYAMSMETFLKYAKPVSAPADKAEDVSTDEKTDNK